MARGETRQTQTKQRKTVTILPFTRSFFALRCLNTAEGFSPHSLRHAFTSAILVGVQSTDLAHLLGHRDINFTRQVYGHLLPSVAKRAVTELDAEFAKWSKS